MQKYDNNPNIKHEKGHVSHRYLDYDIAHFSNCQYTYPYKKVRQSLTNINQCLTSIRQF